MPSQAAPLPTFTAFHTPVTMLRNVSDFFHNATSPAPTATRPPITQPTGPIAAIHAAAILAPFTVAWIPAHTQRAPIVANDATDRAAFLIAAAPAIVHPATIFAPAMVACTPVLTSAGARTVPNVTPSTFAVVVCSRKNPNTLPTRPPTNCNARPTPRNANPSA